MRALIALDSCRSTRLGARSALATALLALAFSTPVLAPEASAEDGEVKITLDRNGLGAQTADGQFEFELGGRVHADGTVHVGDQPENLPGMNMNATDGTELRRARLQMQAKVYEDFHWVGEVDFADDNTSVKDFTLGYSGFEGVRLTAGNQKQPYSLALEMSSNDLPFTERSVDVDFVTTLLDRAIGARIDTNSDHWYFAGGFYGDGMRPEGDEQVEGWGAAAKVVYAPIIEADSVVHIGFRGAFRRPEEGNESLEFKTETTHMSDYYPIMSGLIEDVDGVVLFGPEFAAAFGPVSVFGEYNRAIVLRHPDNRLNFDGFHVGATLSLTGESRAASYRINSAEFKRLIPKQNFSLKNGGWGAWELAGRYAYLDVNKGIIQAGTELPGGTEQSFTVALNWYLNHNVRLMWDYRHILETDQGKLVANGGASPISANKEAAGLSMFTMRVQFAF